MESFVLQISGRKQWSIYDAITPCARAHLKFKPTAEQQRNKRTVRLVQGDVLYFPAGVLHEATTEQKEKGGDGASASMHVTLGIEVDYAFTRAGFLHRALEAFFAAQTARAEGEATVLMASTMQEYKVSWPQFVQLYLAGLAADARHFRMRATLPVLACPASLCITPSRLRALVLSLTPPLMSRPDLRLARSFFRALNAGEDPTGRRPAPLREPLATRYFPDLVESARSQLVAAAAAPVAAKGQDAALDEAAKTEESVWRSNGRQLRETLGAFVSWLGEGEHIGEVYKEFQSAAAAELRRWQEEVDGVLKDEEKRRGKEGPEWSKGTTAADSAAAVVAAAPAATVPAGQSGSSARNEL
jgi:hypothetical protein